MKKIFFLLFLGLLYFGCSSSQGLIYNSNDESWDIEVTKNSITDNFEVIINDSTVIDASPNFFNNNIDAKARYQNKEIKLIVEHTEGFLGLDPSYSAILFINSKMVGRFKF